MKTVNFCFATHNHQPIGNFDYIIEEAYEKSYLPFFKLAKKFNFRFATHFSGILLDWIVNNHPEQIELLRTLVDRGQLEIVSGGFYEPILSVFSEQDRHAQIEKLTTRIEEVFGSKAEGMWLAERVWEQPLAASIHNAKMKYTILDDTHFRAAGLEEGDLTGYYLTEEQGKSITVFPISKELRYSIPFMPVDETIRILHDSATEGGKSIITFADDGEKFGVWPRTFDHVYRDGWLQEFFRKLDENSSWLKTIHFSEALRTLPPKGRIYLPNASYDEMMQWSLPTAKADLKYQAFTQALSKDKSEWEEYRQFVRGGFWRNFFVKYPESNHLHKRVLQLSKRFAQCKESVKKTEAFTQAYEHLLAAQCNDPYWHGVFGGIYLANLRHEVYSNLILAESELDAIQKKSGASCEVVDVNVDGIDDILLANKYFSVYLDPSRGGAISEIDYKPKSFNLTNFINRIREASHEKLTVAENSADNSGTKSIHDLVIKKEKGLEKHLLYDWYRHGSFIDHFLSADATVKDLQKMTFLEHGDFFQTQMKPELSITTSETSVTFDHLGSVFANGISHPVLLSKKLSVKKDSDTIQTRITIMNRSEENLQLRYASEWTFGLLAGNADDRFYESPSKEIKHKKLNSTGEILDASELSLVDKWTGMKITLQPKKPCTFWRTPIETVSLSEAGFERVYQGSIIFALWNISLEPGETWDVTLGICVKNIQSINPNSTDS